MSSLPYSNINIPLKYQKYYESFLHFYIGGVSGAIATLLIQPLDTLKVQVQVVSEQKGKNIKNKFTFIFDVVR